MARHTKLDDLVERRICDALRLGHSYEAAARAGGIDETTLHEWRRRGREGTDGDERFALFRQRVEAADQEAEEKAVAVLRSAFVGEDQKVALSAAQWWLTRRRKVSWGEDKGEAPPTEQECVELVEKIRKAGGA